MIRLITGYAGVGHVTSADAGRFNAGVCGCEAYVMQTGDMFAYTLKSNNEIEIGSGDLVDQGRHFSIPNNASETLEIENGMQNRTRYDAVVMRYTKSSDTGIESASIHIVRGTDVTKGTTPAYPELTHGDIFAGELIDDIPLYYIKITDLNIDAVEQAFKVMPSLTSVADVIYPIGSVYMSMSDTSPAVLFGGKWKQLKDTFLYAAETTGKTGGSKEIKITDNNLPEHTHEIEPHQHMIPAHSHNAEIKQAGGHTHTTKRKKLAATGTARYVPYVSTSSIADSSVDEIKTSSAGAHTHQITIYDSGAKPTEEGGTKQTRPTGKGAPISYMPPYTTVHMWVRTE